jgi:hypothetical protein
LFPPHYSGASLRHVAIDPATVAYALERTLARWANPRYSREAERGLQIAKSAVDRNPSDDGERFR